MGKIRDMLVPVSELWPEVYGAVPRDEWLRNQVFEHLEHSDYKEVDWHLASAVGDVDRLQQLSRQERGALVDRILAGKSSDELILRIVRHTPPDELEALERLAIAEATGIREELDGLAEDVRTLGIADAQALLRNLYDRRDRLESVVRFIRVGGADANVTPLLDAVDETGRAFRDSLELGYDIGTLDATERMKRANTYTIANVWWGCGRRV